MSPAQAASAAAIARTGLDTVVITRAREALVGRRRGLAALVPFLGPAFIASVAYIDPGNFATDIQGGAQFGFRLLWIVVLANLCAMLVQALSAKIGVATGRNLPELCRAHFPLPVNYTLWVIAELAAMTTDVAEFLGAALGFYLLLHIPLLWGALLAGIAVLLILALERRGFRHLEAVIGSFVLIISLAYVFELFVTGPHPAQIAHSLFNVRLPHGATYLAVGILGATVMPHVVYLHSALTQNRIVPRDAAEARKVFRYELADVVIALGIAGLVNAAMLIMAGSVFARLPAASAMTIDQAYATLVPLLGPAAAVVFGVALLAAGLSSSAAGTMSGQVVMQGFVRFAIPLWVRRLVTMIPSFFVIAAGWNPQAVLVFTQVVLSFALPFALVPLALMTARRDVMGELVNGRLVTLLTYGVTLVIMALNVLLILETLKP